MEYCNGKNLKELIDDYESWEKYSISVKKNYVK